MKRQDKEANGSKMKLATTAFLALAMLAVLAALVQPVGFSSGPSITPLSGIRPDTTDSLTCSWSASNDTIQVNVTWYNGSIEFLNVTDILGSNAVLLSTYTARGQNWVCNVTLSNGTDLAVSMVNATIKNAPPTVHNITNMTGQAIGNTTDAIEDAANTFTVLATDPDLDSVIYGYIGQIPSGSSLNVNSGEFTWTPIYTSQNVNVTFYATDSFGESPGITTRKIQFNVVQVNDAPVFSPALSGKSINEGEKFNYNIAATDEEFNYPLNYSITVSPSLNLVIVNTSDTTAVIMFSGNATASFDDAGNYTVNVSAKDSLNATAHSSFVLQIVSVNRPPVLNNASAGLPLGTQGQAYSASFTAYDLDVNQSINFSIQTLSCAYGNIWNNITTNLTLNPSSSNATGNLSISLLTNEHVVCRQAQIIVVDDKGAEDSETVFLNITNTNDPPIVHVLSFHPNNTAGQANLSNLTAYANAVFTYLVNASDIDSLTYEGEFLSYSDNTSLFNISPATGLISFTPMGGDVGLHLINITVTDDSGASDSKIMTLNIISNTAPSIHPLGNITCFEDVECFVFLNASDVDNDNITFESSNPSVFPITLNTSTIPVWTAFVNYTPLQAQVGIYNITITATDIRGASSNLTILFNINNTNDAPQIIDFTFPYAVENHAVAFNVYASDEDYSLVPSYEYVTFSVVNNSGGLFFNITTALNSTNQTFGQVIFTPQAGSAGNYSFNFTATDYFGLQSTISKSFTIHPQTAPPFIDYVRPHTNPDGSANLSFGNASNYPLNSLNINISENTTAVFDINVTDDTTPPGSINYTWFANAELVLKNKSYTSSFGFFSDGIYNISVLVEDTTLENTTFVWNLTVANLNRPPALITNLSNLLSINGTTFVTDYLLFFQSNAKFLDPDDDFNNNSLIGINETSRLNYSVTSCSVATITFDSHSIRVQPSSTGNCSVIFTAIDPEGASLNSNQVLINVTQFNNESTEVIVPVSSSGGGGGGGSARRSPIPIPIVKQDVRPQAIEIIIPEIVTVYENSTVLVPVIVQNNWNGSLNSIFLNATSDVETIRFSFSEDFIDKLEIGEKKNVTLSISNYRLGEDTKIQVTANVSSPVTSDSAYIYLNSIEQSKAGQDVQTKVTFAQDLLNENPECLELNELLSLAKDMIKVNKELEEAQRIVDGVIEGCKYLLSVSKRQEQRPETILQKALSSKYRPYLLSFLAVAIVLSIGLSAVKKKSKAAKLKASQEAARKAKAEEEDKPYWPGA